MDKKSLRKIALEKREAIDSSAAAEKFTQNFIDNVALPKNSIIATYMPIKNELDVGFLCAILQDAGHILCLPHIEGAEMQFYEYKIGDELRANKFGIFEPLSSTKQVEPSVIIVPMLAFDRSKNRLGYGGGYYDKYLQNSTALKVGAAFAAQEIEQIPHEPHDAKMDIIVTDDFIL